MCQNVILCHIGKVSSQQLLFLLWPLMPRFQISFGQHALQLPIFCCFQQWCCGLSSYQILLFLKCGVQNNSPLETSSIKQSSIKRFESNFNFKKNHSVWQFEGTWSFFCIATSNRPSSAAASIWAETRCRSTSISLVRLSTRSNRPSWQWERARIKTSTTATLSTMPRWQLSNTPPPPATTRTRTKQNHDQINNPHEFPESVIPIQFLVSTPLKKDTFLWVLIPS